MKQIAQGYNKVNCNWWMIIITALLLASVLTIKVYSLIIDLTSYPLPLSPQLVIGNFVYLAGLSLAVGIFIIFDNLKDDFRNRLFHMIFQIIVSICILGAVISGYINSPPTRFINIMSRIALLSQSFLILVFVIFKMLSRNISNHLQQKIISVMFVFFLCMLIIPQLIASIPENWPMLTIYFRFNDTMTLLSLFVTIMLITFRKKITRRVYFFFMIFQLSLFLVTLGLWLAAELTFRPFFQFGWFSVNILIRITPLLLITINSITYHFCDTVIVHQQ